MHVESAVHPILGSVFQGNLTEFNKQKETFHQILKRMVDSKSSSRPPKIELTGILIPCDLIEKGLCFKYKLETDSNEYFLSLSNELLRIAGKAEWEKVTIKGLLNHEAKIIEVEKIFFPEDSQPLKIATSLGDYFFDIATYKRLIDRRGKIEPSPDFLAS